MWSGLTPPDIELTRLISTFQTYFHSLPSHSTMYHHSLSTTLATSASQSFHTRILFTRPSYSATVVCTRGVTLRRYWTAVCVCVPGQQPAPSGTLKGGIQTCSIASREKSSVQVSWSFVSPVVFSVVWDEFSLYVLPTIAKGLPGRCPSRQVTS